MLFFKKKKKKKQRLLYEQEKKEEEDESLEDPAFIADINMELIISNIKKNSRFKIDNSVGKHSNNDRKGNVRIKRNCIPDYTSKKGGSLSSDTTVEMRKGHPEVDRYARMAANSTGLAVEDVGDKYVIRKSILKNRR